MTKICKGLDGCWLSLLWLWTCLGDQERPRSAETLQRCHETGHFGHEFWVVPVTSSVPTDFLPASLGKQAKHSSLRQGAPSPGVVGCVITERQAATEWNHFSGFTLHCLTWLGSWQTHRRWEESPPQAAFSCTALLSELRWGMLLCHPLSQWCSFCSPWGGCVPFCSSSYVRKSMLLS